MPNDTRSSSILNSVKHVLGILEEYTEFDTDIVMHINSTLMILTQLGVGPSEGFMIEGATETWEDFMGDNPLFAAVKSYIFIKVRILFDPPQSGAVLNAMKEQAAEYEWRIGVNYDHKVINGEDEKEDEKRNRYLPRF